MRHTVNMGLPTMMFYPSLITPLCFRVVALTNKTRRAANFSICTNFIEIYLWAMYRCLQFNWSGLGLAVE